MKLNKIFSLFILPPSLAALYERLAKRDTDSLEQKLRRMENAKVEIAEAVNYDLCLVNENFGTCYNRLVSAFVHREWDETLAKSAKNFISELLKDNSK